MVPGAGERIHFADGNFYQIMFDVWESERVVNFNPGTSRKFPITIQYSIVVPGVLTGIEV